MDEIRDAVALIALTLAGVLGTIGGLLISPAAGLYTLAAFCLSVALLFGYRRS